MSEIISTAHIVSAITNSTEFYKQVNTAIFDMQSDALEVEAQYSVTADFFSVLLLGRKTQLYAAREIEKRKEFQLDQDIQE